MKDSTVQTDTPHEADSATDDRSKYELMVIIDPDLGENGAKKRLDEIRKLLGHQKAEIFFEDIWGLRDLSYPIKKRRKGFYVVFDFTLLPAKLKEIDSTITLDREVLRHMVVKLPFKYEAKSYAVLEVEEKKPVVEKQPYPPKFAPKKKTEKPEEKKQEVVAEEPAKKTSRKTEEKKETSLEEVDAKLKSIIDNPDINF